MNETRLNQLSPLPFSWFPDLIQGSMLHSDWLFSNDNLQNQGLKIKSLHRVYEAIGSVHCTKQTNKLSKTFNYALMTTYTSVCMFKNGNTRTINQTWRVFFPNLLNSTDKM